MQKVAGQRTSADVVTVNDLSFALDVDFTMSNLTLDVGVGQDAGSSHPA